MITARPFCCILVSDAREPFLMTLQHHLMPLSHEKGDPQTKEERRKVKRHGKRQPGESDNVGTPETDNASIQKAEAPFPLIMRRKDSDRQIAGVQDCK